MPPVAVRLNMSVHEGTVSFKLTRNVTYVVYPNTELQSLEL